MTSAATTSAAKRAHPCIRFRRIAGLAGLLAGLLTLPMSLFAQETPEQEPPVADEKLAVSDHRTFVEYLYRQFYARSGDPFGVNYWAGRLATQSLTSTDVVMAFLNAPEYYAHTAAVARLHHAALGGIPSSAALLNAVMRHRNGQSLSDMAAALSQTSEFNQRFGSNLNNAQYVGALYQQILGRIPDAGGRAFWINQLEAGTTRADVLVQFSESLEYQVSSDDRITIDLIYHGLVGRLPTDQEVASGQMQPMHELINTVLASEVFRPTLIARALLPAATFAEGPTSGTAIGNGPINGQVIPFIDKQPVQGFSALLDNGDGTHLALIDNGFGSLENSADALLRAYVIRVDFRTREGGTGNISVERFIQFRDPNRHIPFAITHHFTEDRLLTGADFDPESIRRAPDGTLWIGDEFGPFLLHTSADGIVLEAPIPLPDFANPGKELRAPQNPYHEEASAVRIMNALRTHARLHGNRRTPVFSPYHVMLKYAAKTTAPAHPGSNPNLHYARGNNPQPGLKAAASDVFDVRSIRSAGYPLVTWTVNDKARMLELLAVGVDGIISDRPDLLLESVREFDANGDGVAGDYLQADGRIDINKFDAQGHRGARNLRPENTLPAMEAALDYLMTTLETDTGVTSDGVSILSHDPYVEAAKCRRADGTPYTSADDVLIKNHTVAEIQSLFICDKLFRGPSQINDPAASPVTAAFVAQRTLAHPYMLPTVQQLFDFVNFYVAYYRDGAGRTHPQAMQRWMNAAAVRFNIETKINPRSDRDGLGNVYKERTFAPQAFVTALAGVITANNLADRADIQSFDFRSLLLIQEQFPAIRTVYLFGDFPIYPSPDSDDSTNLQDENGANTPWLAGLYWPYRETVANTPFRVPGSGGFEGMAITPDNRRLMTLLEKPLVGVTDNTLLIHEFDLVNKRYTGVFHRYPFDARGNAIGDFTMINATQGLIIERDGSQGDLNGYKAIHKITLRGNNQMVGKELLVDLLRISDPYGIALGLPGDVGIGGGMFALPFVTIESVLILDNHRIIVANDNNYPFSVGRHIGNRAPDDNEIIVIELPRPLN